ncbi:MAG: lipocalin family protein [Campylobacterales bacterium]|nr:lipocalin family protein [Campylobacterales bacterium]
MSNANNKYFKSDLCLKLATLIILGIILTGCGKKYPDLPTVKQVDIQKYQGTWYEIARFEHFFEKGCKNVTATYELKNDGDLKVINRCTMIENNDFNEATGVAYAVDDTNSKLKVSFFRPFYGDYYIIDLADDYSYAVVGAPSRELLWILSRTKTIDTSIKNKILDKLPTLGFDPDKFIWTIQE